MTRQEKLDKLQEDTAKKLYEKYCETVLRTVCGEPQSWDEFCADENNSLKVEAWINVADVALYEIGL